MSSPIWHAMLELADKGARDVCLRGRAEGTRKKFPQRRDPSWSMRIARNDPGPNKGEMAESQSAQRVLLLTHDADIMDPAARVASGRGEQSEALDTGCLATACEGANHAHFQPPHVFLAPLLAALTDPDAGRGINGFPVVQHLPWRESRSWAIARSGSDRVRGATPDGTRSSTVALTGRLRKDGGRPPGVIDLLHQPGPLGIQLFLRDGLPPEA